MHLAYIPYISRIFLIDTINQFLYKIIIKEKLLIIEDMDIESSSSSVLIVGTIRPYIQISIYTYTITHEVNK